MCTVLLPPGGCQPNCSWIYRIIHEKCQSERALFQIVNSRFRWSTNSPVFRGTRWFIDFPANPVHPHIPYRLRSVIILSSCLRLDFPRGFFPSGFPTEICAQGCSWERCGRSGCRAKGRQNDYFEWKLNCAQHILNYRTKWKEIR